MPSYRRVLREAADEMIREALGPDASLLEAWSDAARAASAAARAAKAKGGDWRKAARTAIKRRSKSVTAPGVSGWENYPVGQSQEVRYAAGRRRSKVGDAAYAKAKAEHYYNGRNNLDKAHQSRVIHDDASRARRAAWSKEESRRYSRFR